MATNIATIDTKAGIFAAASETTLQRLAADASTARMTGFALAPPVRAIGTPLVQVGQENLGASRSAFERLPEAQAGLDRVAAMVRAECRKDVEVYPAEVSMLPTGNLGTQGGIFTFEEGAFGSLCARVTPGGAGYLAQCPTVLRATNINHWLRTQGEGDNNPFVVRTRRSAEGELRSIFGVVSDRYKKMDVDEVAQALAQHVEKGARVDAKYDGRAVRIDVHYHSDIKPSEAAAGEVFKAGVRLTTADDGSQPIRVEAFVIRNLCVNLIILDRADIKTLNKRHTGQNLHELVHAGIERAAACVKDFGRAWGEAEMDRVIDESNSARPAEVFNRLVERGLVKIPGCAKEDLAKRLLQAWQTEPGYTRRSIVNAVTKAAHTSRWSTVWAQEELERQGGQLLYVRTLAKLLSAN